MGKIVGSVIIAAFIGIAALYADVAGATKAYQIVDLYVCEEGIVLAEMLAKSSVSRKELYVVSYCTCEGVNSDMKSQVKVSSCEAPKNMVYSCICIGRSSY
ncbi:MAG TPA: hypothetical protein PK926_10325 [Spirochaetota bacterium]|nr:hypothetical protein [Spirochaetota bacterium]HPI90069.1 hypothetical protein [Spirochaetota bacterium]HPR47856.1 hypothetical protein [Spirochaetota bacterium]